MTKKDKPNSYYLLTLESFVIQYIYNVICLNIIGIHHSRYHPYVRCIATFKQQLCFENLLMPNSRERISLTKYRCTNSKLPIYKQIYLFDSDILCSLCNLHCTADECHYILIYSFFRKERELFLKIYYFMLPSMHKFVNLFCSTNKRTQRRIAILDHIVMTSFLS